MKVIKMKEYKRISIDEYNEYMNLRRKNRIMADSFYSIHNYALLIKILSEAYFSIEDENPVFSKDEVFNLIFSSADLLFSSADSYMNLVNC